MDSEKFYIYTDASFSKELQLGVAGWLVFRRASSETIRTVSFKETNNIRAEIKGVILALKEASQGLSGEIHLYTDCQTIAGLSNRREKLETSNYRSHQKRAALRNADLYRELFRLYDSLNPMIHWIKGHSPKRNQSIEQRNLSKIDQVVRKELRKLLSNPE